MIQMKLGITKDKATKNSHIQLNKAIMERFSFWAEDLASGVHKSKVRMVYCLDIFSKEIRTEKIKKLGTKFGYFSDAMEDELGSIETEFMQIVQKFDKWKQGDNYDLQSDEIKIKEFADLLLARSEMRREQMQLLVTHIFMEKYKGDEHMLAKHPISIVPSPIFKDGYGVTLLINETDKNFVIARNGFCFASPNGKESCFILPISPKRAIILFKKSHQSQYMAQGNPLIGVAYISDEHSISALNNSALLTEKTVDKAFVISKTRDELEELLEFIKSDKWELFKSMSN